MPFWHAGIFWWIMLVSSGELSLDDQSFLRFARWLFLGKTAPCARLTRPTQVQSSDLFVAARQRGGIFSRSKGMYDRSRSMVCCITAGISTYFVFCAIWAKPRNQVHLLCVEPKRGNQLWYQWIPRTFVESIGYSTVAVRWKIGWYFYKLICFWLFFESQNHPDIKVEPGEGGRVPNLVGPILSFVLQDDTSVLSEDLFAMAKKTADQADILTDRSLKRILGWLFGDKWQKRQSGEKPLEYTNDFHNYLE